MIRALLSITFIFFLGLGFSQSLSLSPNPATATVNANDTDIAAKATLTNNSDQTKEFLWTRKIVDLTQGWQTAVCDFNLCYNPTIDSMTLTLAPGEESNLDIHVYPNGVIGKAEVELSIKEVGVDSNAVTGSYLFNVTTPVRKVELEEISIFPNPTTDYFQINSNETIAKIEVLNLAMSKVKTFYGYRNKKYYVGDLSDGMYFVKLIGKDNRNIKAVRLKKD